MSLNAPLSGVRIADFTIHAAGPFCTHLLSQLGAQCIKIESKARPDAFRKPHPVYGRMSAATFDQVASNKLSVRLNLKEPEAVELARQIVAKSQVAATSFRPGVMQRLGLGFEELEKVNPAIVLVSISASGQTGPDSHFGGYAPLFGAWGGLGWLTGYEDGPPVEMRHAMDHTAGLHAALAVVAALHQARRTGQSQHVDLAAREVASAMIGDALVQASLGEQSVRLGNADLRMAPHGVYETNRADRWLSLAIQSDQEWNSFLQVMNKPAMPEYETVAQRQANRRALDEIVASWVSQFSAEPLEHALQQAGVSAHVSWTMEDVAACEHLRERGSVVSVGSDAAQPRFAVSSPARFSKTSEVGLHRLTPELGEHEDYVFGEILGLTTAQRRVLEDRKIIY